MSPWSGLKVFHRLTWCLGSTGFTVSRSDVVAGLGDGQGGVGTITPWSWDQLCVCVCVCVCVC